jgi:hypothetical protein
MRHYVSQKNWCATNTVKTQSVGVCQAGLSNICDNDLEEIIALNSVSMIVAEYIPVGAN